MRITYDPVKREKTLLERELDFENTIVVSAKDTLEVESLDVTMTKDECSDNCMICNIHINYIQINNIQALPLKQAFRQTIFLCMLILKQKMFMGKTLRPRIYYSKFFSSKKHGINISTNNISEPISCFR